MPKRPYIAVTMTFRDKKVLKFFKERCSNTKFDKAWAVRNIFEDYFDRIKNNPDILAFEINEASLPIKYSAHKEKVVVKVCIFNPDAISFLRDITAKNARAFFVKNVILLYFYNRPAYESPEIFLGKNPTLQTDTVKAAEPDLNNTDDNDNESSVNATAMPDMSRVQTVDVSNVLSDF